MESKSIVMNRFRTQGFLKQLNGKNSGIFNQFIENNYHNDNLQIAFYPSSFRDFRALLYLSEAYRESVSPKLEKLSSPDLFIYCDYMPWEESHEWLQAAILFQDENTTIRVINSEWLPNLSFHSGFVPLVQSELVTSTGNSILANRVKFFNLEIQSNQLGTFCKPLLYVFAINEMFFRSYIARCRPTISHVIKVRYGSGLGGGGKATGMWLRHVLGFMNTKYLITDDQSYYNEADTLYLNLFLSGKFNETNDDVNLRRMHKIPGQLWSNYGDITFSKVTPKKNLPKKFIRYPWRVGYSDQKEHLVKAFIYKVISLFPKLVLDSSRRMLNQRWNDQALACFDILRGKGFSKDAPLRVLPKQDLDKLLENFGYQQISLVFDGYHMEYPRKTPIGKVVFQNDRGGQIELFALNPSLKSQPQ